MVAALEIILSLLAVIGLLGLGWLLFGRLLTPAGDHCVSVIPGTGNGEGLEQTVTGLMWLRGGGLLAGEVVIADCGLSAEGRAIAQALLLRESSLGMCPAEELPGYLRDSLDRKTGAGE